METLMLPFSPRYIVLTICVAVTALLLGIGIVDHKVFGPVLIPILVFGGLTAMGVRDLLQKNHAILRNYPISAQLRLLLEEIRPEMRQYFFESEKDGVPFFPRHPRRRLSACENSVWGRGRSVPRRMSIAMAMNGFIIR